MVSAGPLVWFGVLSVALGLLIAVLAWRQRESTGARTYAVLMVVLAVWSGTYAGQLLGPTVAAKYPWLLARYALTPLIGVLFWVFGARYTDRSELLGVRYLAPILGVGALLTIAPIVTPDLYWYGLSLSGRGAHARLVIRFGPEVWLAVLYIVTVVGGGHAVIVATLRDSFSVYRRQLTGMAVVGAIEFTLMALFLSEHVDFVPSLTPWPHVQLLTYSTVLVAIPLGWSYFRESLFGLPVIDRQAVIEHMTEGVFVFDPDGVLRNVNEPGRRLLDDPTDATGKHVSDVFTQSPVLLDTYQSGVATDGGVEGKTDAFDTIPDDATSLEDAVQLTVDGEPRWYDLRVSAIRNSAGDHAGTVVVARDVTARRQRREMLRERTAELEEKTERLERQNERLDRFASVVSHDLRNPLTVISGHLDVIRDDAPEADVEAIAQNLDRMETMIDDLLTMARAGQAVEDTEPVALADVARSAWSHADTTDCTLDCRVPADVTVEADRDRLLHVFENLFRNAIDHNNPPLTVTVGRLNSTGEPGFYVADDGDGIPPEERARAFEHGYTTSDDGSGLGLAIVADIVDGHDWEIRIVDSDDGGARFEITGVDLERSA